MKSLRRFRTYRKLVDWLQFKTRIEGFMYNAIQEVIEDELQVILVFHHEGERFEMRMYNVPQIGSEITYINSLFTQTEFKVLMTNYSHNGCVINLKVEKIKTIHFSK